MIKYLITDPKYYSSEPLEFKNRLIEVLSKNRVDFVCFRDKTKTSNKNLLAKIFKEQSIKAGIEKIVINRYIEIALKEEFNTIHLNSDQFSSIEYCKKSGLEVIISVHTIKEAKKAKNLNADFITLSPIFASPLKGEAKGLGFLKECLDSVDIKVIALGGIVDEKQIKEIESTEAYGWASIRAFI